ncbi:nodulin-related family protein [Tripterygium wilfordii]|uniref:Nodulin-related family protein n=1 Tax=Tripterygium wilfordii TaxID=458696 RepID=A0A7J7DF44_TRIWF|nr:nodulin-related family protein [Tripterygium wilfordii]
MLLLLCLTALAGDSICWINTVCYAVAISNFPSIVKSLMDWRPSFQGLTAKIYTDVVDLAFNSSPTKRAQGYVLLNSLLPLIVSVICTLLARDVGAEGTTNMRGGFIAMFIITAIIGVYAVLSSVKPISTNILSPVGSLVAVCLLLLLPLGIPLVEKLRVAWEKKVHIPNNNARLEAVESRFQAVEEDIEVEKKEEVESVIEEIGAWVMLRRVNFWLYFLVYLFGATLGIVFLNNLGQVAESRGYHGTNFVSLSSAFSFTYSISHGVLLFKVKNTHQFQVYSVNKFHYSRL